MISKTIITIITLVCFYLIYRKYIQTTEYFGNRGGVDVIDLKTFETET